MTHILCHFHKVIKLYYIVIIKCGYLNIGNEKLLIVGQQSMFKVLRMRQQLLTIDESFRLIEAAMLDKFVSIMGSEHAHCTFCPLYRP